MLPGYYVSVQSVWPAVITLFASPCAMITAIAAANIALVPACARASPAMVRGPSASASTPAGLPREQAKRAHAREQAAPGMPSCNRQVAAAAAAAKEQTATASAAVGPAAACPTQPLALTRAAASSQPRCSERGQMSANASCRHAQNQGGQPKNLDRPRAERGAPEGLREVGSNPCPVRGAGGTFDRRSLWARLLAFRSSERPGLCGAPPEDAAHAPKHFEEAAHLAQVDDAPDGESKASGGEQRRPRRAAAAAPGG
eukprot:scaffold14367_cov129-Isochrysis_galbana.AAC.2